jgi:hypothetical protein
MTSALLLRHICRIIGVHGRKLICSVMPALLSPGEYKGPLNDAVCLTAA